MNPCQATRSILVVIKSAIPSGIAVAVPRKYFVLSRINKLTFMNYLHICCQKQTSMTMDILSCRQWMGSYVAFNE